MENEHEDREVAAATLLRTTERLINDTFQDDGYAIRNPNLVSAVFTALMRDYTKVHEMHIMAALARQNMGLVAMANVSNGAPQ